jgi:DNA-binding NtrC family response regulator
LRFTPEALQALLHEEWPGNVRQLRNLIDRVAVFADSEEITPSELNYATERSTAEADDALRRHVRAVLQIPDVSKRLLKTERTFIEEALRMCDQNKSAAARLLGVHRKYVERRSGPERWDDREDDED